MGFTKIRNNRPQALTEQGLAAGLRIVARNGGNLLRLIPRRVLRRKCV